MTSNRLLNIFFRGGCRDRGSIESKLVARTRENTHHVHFRAPFRPPKLIGASDTALLLGEDKDATLRIFLYGYPRLENSLTFHRDQA